MPLDYEPVELPLFVGMGEGKDSQLRTSEAVVSENVSFQKDGSVKTRTYLDVVAQHTSDLEGVTYADEEFYVNSDTQLMKVLADNSLGDPTTFSLPRTEDVTYLKTSGMTVGWVRAVVVGDYTVVSWLESNTVGYAIEVALFDNEDNAVQEATTVYNGGVLPTYELLETPTGVAIVYGIAGIGNPTTSPSVEAVLCTVTDDTLIVTGTFNFPLGAAGYLKSLSAAVTSTDIVIVGNQWADLTPSTQNTQEGTTFILRMSFAGTFTASAVISSDGAPTAYAGHILCSVGYDSVEDVVWLALVSSMKIQVAPVVGVAPGAITDLTTITPTGVYSTPAYNRIPSNDPVHFAQLMCGRFVFSGTSRWFVATSFDHPIDATASEVYPRNYAHLAAFSLPAAPAAASFSYVSPHTLLAGIPYIDAFGEVIIPVCISDCWAKTWDTTGQSTIKTTSVGVQNMVVGGSTFVAFDETQTSEPLYYTAGLAEVVNGELVVTSVFGFDEVRPQNGVSLGYNLDESTLLQQTRCESYNEPIGGLVYLNKTLKFYHPRRRVNAGVPHNGTGSSSAGFLQPDTWNHSLAVSNLSARQKLHLEGGRDFLVASTGFASLVDKGQVFPTSFLVPPDLNATVYTGSGADDYVRKFIAVWAWLDSKGIYHRGPPSHAVQGQFRLWDTGIDEGTTHVSGYPKLQGLDSSQVFLEIYAEPVAAGVVTTGTFTLYHRQAGGDRVPAITLHMRDSDPAAPLLYTTGGVLPNESRPAKGRLVIAKGRVWTFDKNQVFYSNEVGVDLPVEFNSNLFIDSPDGSPFTGIASMDEQVVLFTQRGIHVARGPGVNRLGSGPGFNLSSITTPTGCRSDLSVVETDMGVVFLGERGLHLLGRDFKVQFLSNTEDSLTTIIAAEYDRTNKEVLFVTATGTFVLDMRSGLWTKVNIGRESLNDITWTVDGIAAVSDDTLLRNVGTPVDTFPKETSPPMQHSTPWIEFGSHQSSQRITNILIQGHATIGPRYIPAVRDAQGSLVTASETRAVDDRATLTIKLYVDHDDEPCFTRLIDLRTIPLDPLEIRVLNPRQRCRALRVEVCTEEANLDLTLTSIVAMAGRKRGADKRQITAGT